MLTLAIFGVPRPFMLPNRICISKTASEQLKLLKARTGITPNILARMALVRSIKEKFDYTLKEVASDGLEFQMSSLLGEYALLYEKLLMELHAIPDHHELSKALAAHIENGLSYIKNVKDLKDLLNQIA